MRRFWDRISVEVIAAVLGAFVLGAIAMNAATRTLRDWTPNVATEAASLLVTILVVDRVVRREDKRRYGKWEARVLGQIGAATRSITGQLITDYAQTHRDTYSPPPRRLDAAVAHYLAGFQTADMPHLVIGGMDGLLLGAKNCADYLAAFKAGDQAVLDPDLIVAIDAFKAHVELANVITLVSNTTVGGPPPAEANAARANAHTTIGEAVAILIEGYTKQAGKAALPELLDREIRSAELMRQGVIEGRLRSS
jgi:hypothetical protein